MYAGAFSAPENNGPRPSLSLVEAETGGVDATRGRDGPWLCVVEPAPEGDRGTEPKNTGRISAPETSRESADLGAVVAQRATTVTKYYVVRGEDRVEGPFDTHAAAKKRADELSTSDVGLAYTVESVRED